MRFIGIIPARYESTRFPGKPLVNIHGKSMIQRVYEQCVKAKLDQVIVATDDERIYTHVKGFNGEVVMTSSEHQSGTDRIAEAADKLNLDSTSIIINIQGDEPFISPDDIKQVGECFTDESVQIATLIKKISDLETLTNPNTPKVVLGANKQALYFSREAIPHLRGVDKKDWLDQQNYFQHIGIYAFKRSVLNEITKLKSSHLEKCEGLEQLRWLENGYTIQTSETKLECVAVDTPEDLKRIEEKFFS